MKVYFYLPLSLRVYYFVPIEAANSLETIEDNVETKLVVFCLLISMLLLCVGSECVLECVPSILSIWLRKKTMMVMMIAMYPLDSFKISSFRFRLCDSRL